MLCFIPIDYVVGVFYKLKEKIEKNKFIELIAFVDYFEKQYIRSNKELDWWNYHDGQLFKTNNPCESYNNRLYNLFNKKKPGFFEFISIINKECEEIKINFVNNL